MTRGDALPLFVNPPDELSDEAIYAISEYLNEICRSFENRYYAHIHRYLEARQREERERVCESHPREARDEEEPF